MAMGMTYDEYWDGEVQMHKQVRKAYRIKQEHADYQAWLNGMYVCEAIATCFSGKKKAHKYPSEPYSTKQREEQERHREQVRKERAAADVRFNAYMTAWMSMVNKSMKGKEMKSKGGETDGS